MTEEFKLHWELYYKRFPTNKIKADLKNLLTKYLELEKGKVIDIGCGQSPYLLDLLESSYELYAVDIEPVQIEYLKKRVEDLDFQINRINYSTDKFPNNDFGNLEFSGIILSNVLQFYTFKEAEIFSKSIIKSLSKNGVVVITAHSWKHHGNKKEKDYFKHFYSKSDFYKLFPKKQFKYLYVEEKQYQLDNENREFIKDWIKQIHTKIWNRNDSVAIEKKQKEYLSESRIDNITIVLKKV